MWSYLLWLLKFTNSLRTWCIFLSNLCCRNSLIIVIGKICLSQASYSSLTVVSHILSASLCMWNLILLYLFDQVEFFFNVYFIFCIISNTACIELNRGYDSCSCTLKIIGTNTVLMQLPFFCFLFILDRCFSYTLLLCSSRLFCIFSCLVHYLCLFFSWLLDWSY